MEISIPDNTIHLSLKSLLSVKLNTGYFLFANRFRQAKQIKYWSILKLEFYLFYVSHKRRHQLKMSNKQESCISIKNVVFLLKMVIPYHSSL